MLVLLWPAWKFAKTLKHDIAIVVAYIISIAMWVAFPATFLASMTLIYLGLWIWFINQLIKNDWKFKGFNLTVMLIANLVMAGKFWFVSRVIESLFIAVIWACLVVIAFLLVLSLFPFLKKK